jgi:hypothetical protein
MIRDTDPLDLINTGHLLDEETACYSQSGVLLNSTAQLEFDSSYGCIYQCFSSPTPPIRTKGDLIVVLESHIQDRYFTIALILAIIVMVVTSLTIFPAYFFIKQQRRDDRRTTQQVNNHRNTSTGLKIAKVLYYTACPLLCLAIIGFNEDWLRRGGLP